jgi:hypothetical protein
VVGIDFVNDVSHDEQIITSTWTIEVKQGSDPNPKPHLQGTSLPVIPFGSIMKTATVQRVGGLWPNVTYKLEAVVITDKGNTRSLYSHIRGINPN